MFSFWPYAFAMRKDCLGPSRGAVTNPQCRYDRLRTEPVDDGWPGTERTARRSGLTRVIPSPAKSIISANDSPDIPFGQSINPYRGCEHGCAYCFARPSHAWLGLSPGLDFEAKIAVKSNAPALLERELRRPGYRVRPLAVGSNTDPYQPAEAHCRIMRACLEVMADFRQPVAITTKSALVTRDIDLLASMATQRLAVVHLSITTLDPVLAKKLEPRAPPPAKRLAAIRALALAGIPVGVMVAPVIPVLTEPELERIMAAAREAGARTAHYALLRLPREVQDIFTAWLQAHAPDSAGHVLSRIRAMRDGALDDPAFGRRFTGEGPEAQILAQRAALACRRLGFAQTMDPLDTSLFAPPPRRGEQLSLF